MKKIIKFLVFTMIAGVLATSCEKDQYTEEEALEQQQLVDVVIAILDASSDLESLNGVTVKIVVDNEIVSDSTNSDGLVIFEDVKIGGNIIVTATKNNYTSIWGEVNTSIGNFRQRQVHETFYMYSTASDKIATVKGRLIYETDVTNREVEPVVGEVVRVDNNDLATGRDQLFTGTTDADGYYEVQVPVSSFGQDDLVVYYPEIIDDQTVALEQEDGTYAVETRGVIYSASLTGFYISAVPSVYATVPAPGGSTVGSDFMLNAQAQKTNLSSYSTVYIEHGGTGYTAGTVNFSLGANGVAAQATIGVDGNGAITSVTIVDNGAVYNAEPTLSVTGGTGAVLDIQYQTTYSIFISNRGTGYISYPKVSIEALDYLSNVLTKRVDDDINDASDNIIGMSNLLTVRANIVNGSIYPNYGSANADTIDYTSPLASKPIFTVYNKPTVSGVLRIQTSDIGTDSTLLAVDIITVGFGYDPLSPPAVTLHVVGAYGSGAMVKAEASAARSLSNMEITDPGFGYVKDVNDFDSDGSTGSDRRNPSAGSTNVNNVVAGQTYVRNVDYGTGYQLVEID